ncbi:phage tail protein [Flavobacterium chilense]|uniref:Microcystin-dependent protein n=1 Tax=Flavobacterium chilense TaxID=946677 RepID=A0A1M7HLG9_9FLAO|nr:tail fiber protein [Flavobacterium chilense]SHM29391.1 Microcystin-dependent protein [Flavobacterium chilense]
MEGTIGEIRLFAGNFPPLNWAFCNGSSQSIANYEALFVIIGTTYGGDGQVTFNLPDLRSRVPVGTGQGPGLPNIVLGQVGGTETATMTINQMPSHTHVATGSIALPAYNATGESGSPTNTILAGLADAYSTAQADTNLKAQTSAVTLNNTGSNNPFSIIQPYLSTNYIICMQGIFPTRN